MAETPENLLRRWVLAREPKGTDWVANELACLSASGRERDLQIFLGLAPRRLGKADLALDPADLAAADAARPGWTPAGWSLDGAARVLGLLTFRGQRPFAETFKDLSRTADAAELIALYRGMPLYPDPEALTFEVGEGLRSNLRPVFEALAHNNPFPRDHFDDHRWNHMILKALFIESRLAPIVGLKARANPELARILLDYARERWTAGRPVTHELWLPVKPFADHPDIRPALEEAVAIGRLREEAVA